MDARVGPAAREAVFAQLAEAGRAEQVAKRLSDAITLGVLNPGERLPSEPELARRFGVALITVRDGLGMLREAGLVATRRGRDGGSFVVEADAGHSGLLEARLRALPQVDLSDMAVYFGVLLGGSAEQAAKRATPEESGRLLEWQRRADSTSPASARRNAGGFYLELAVLSQSARLVREQIRVQAEFGPLLLLSLDDSAVRATIYAENLAIAEAVAARDVHAARTRATAEVAALAEWLHAEKARITRGAQAVG